MLFKLGKPVYRGLGIGGEVFMKARLVIGISLLLSATCCYGRLYDWHDWAWYVSMYGGWSQTGSGSVDGSAKDNTYDIDGKLIAEGTKYPLHSSYDSNGSFLAGTRAGIWLPQTGGRFGLAGDIFYSRIDSGSDDTQLTLSPLSILLLYRLPLLVSEDFSHGRLQPYFGVGLVGVLGDVSTRVEREDGSTFKVDTAVSGGGGSAHAGFACCIDQHWSIFFEYRYLLTGDLSGSKKPSDYGNWHDYSDADDTYKSTRASIDASSIEAHQLFGGVTFSF